MECNWRGLDSTGWKNVGCKDPVSIKCKVCGNYSCASHKYTLGQISPGVSVGACSKCYHKVVKAGIENNYQGQRNYKYIDQSPNPFKIILPVKSNLCCVLNPVRPCKCGHQICIRCYDDKIKPHDQCQYIYARKLIAWAKKNI